MCMLRSVATWRRSKAPRSIRFSGCSRRMRIGFGRNGKQTTRRLKLPTAFSIKSWNHSKTVRDMLCRKGSATSISLLRGNTHVNYLRPAIRCQAERSCPISRHIRISAQRRRRLAQGGPGERGTPPMFRLFGYAGTGKTTLARHIAESVDGKVLFAAFTGKAAQVMRNKGCDGASTIHRLIYRARESGEETPELRIVGRRAGLQGQADHHRRMLDGRRRARPRPDVVRRAGAGARRSRAIAADPGRRLFHREPSPTRC